MNTIVQDGISVQTQIEAFQKLHSDALAYAAQWRADAQLVDIYGPSACANFARVAQEWDGRAKRYAAEVAQLKTELEDGDDRP